MDQPNDTPPLGDSAPTYYAPPTIHPCAATESPDGKVCGTFHLLKCGHIIFIDDGDLRCGRNCRHAAQLMIEHGTNILQATDTQYLDNLYCEVCNGIPSSRYKLLNSTETLSTLRTAFTLNRRMLLSSLGLLNNDVNALLCSPFVDRRREDFYGQHVHRLQCGHEVWSVEARPCAANCACEDVDDGRVTVVFRGKMFDVIFCQECVARAELVYHRFEKLEAEKEREKGKGNAKKRRKNDKGTADEKE